MTDPGDVPLDIQLAVTLLSPASPRSIWDVIWDLDAYGTWNPECVEAHWIDGAVEPAVGARFSGRNVLGDQSWTVTCHIVECDRPFHVAWTVSEPARPSSTWSYDLVESAGETTVTQRFRHGPGSSGIRSRIRDRPDQARIVIAARSRMLEENMRTGLGRVLEIAEGRA